MKRQKIMKNNILKITCFVQPAVQNQKYSINCHIRQREATNHHIKELKLGLEKLLF